MQTQATASGAAEGGSVEEVLPADTKAGPRAPVGVAGLERFRGAMVFPAVTTGALMP